MTVRRGVVWLETEESQQRTPEQKLALAILSGALHDLHTKARARSKGESLHAYGAYLRHLARSLRDAARFFSRPKESQLPVLAAALELDCAAIREGLQKDIRDALHRARHIDQDLVPAVLRHIEATRRPPGRPRKDRPPCNAGNETARSKASEEKSST